MYRGFSHFKKPMIIGNYRTTPILNVDQLNCKPICIRDIRAMASWHLHDTERVTLYAKPSEFESAVTGSYIWVMHSLIGHACNQIMSVDLVESPLTSVSSTSILVHFY